MKPILLGLSAASLLAFAAVASAQPADPGYAQQQQQYQGQQQQYQDAQAQYHHEQAVYKERRAR